MIKSQCFVLFGHAKNTKKGKIALGLEYSVVINVVDNTQL